MVNDFMTVRVGGNVGSGDRWLVQRPHDEFRVFCIRLPRSEGAWARLSPSWPNAVVVLLPRCASVSGTRIGGRLGGRPSVVQRGIPWL
jgi:hypothetical protein